MLSPSPGTTIKLEANIEHCPRCASLAGAIDGIYSYAAEVRRVAVSLSKTPRLLIDAAHLARRAAQEEVSQEDAVREAASIAPQLGKLFSRTYKLFTNHMAVAGVLIGLAGVFQAHWANKSTDEAMGRLIDVQHQQVQYQQEIASLLRVIARNEKGDQGEPEEYTAGPSPRLKPEQYKRVTKGNPKKDTSRNKRHRAAELQRKKCD